MVRFGDTFVKEDHYFSAIGAQPISSNITLPSKQLMILSRRACAHQNGNKIDSYVNAPSRRGNIFNFSFKIS